MNKCIKYLSVVDNSGPNFDILNAKRLNSAANAVVLPEAQQVYFTSTTRTFEAFKLRGSV